jgi:oligosaccharide reducing-end xylanase
VLVPKSKLSAVSLAVFIGLVGCGSPGDAPSDELSSAGASGAVGGSGGGTGATASGGSSATGGTAAGGGTGGSSGNPTGGIGGNPTGGTGGNPTGGIGGNPTGGIGGNPTGGVGGGPTGGSGGGPTGGAGGNPTGGAGGDAGGTGECTPPAEYTNLFVTLSGHTQEETDAKISAAWSQLYNPSNSNTVYYDGPGADESYVKDTGNNDVRTEGMSYGMMTAVQLDRQTEFDRLWAWVKNHMAQGTGQIAWQCNTSGGKISTGGAPDGEEYFATALIFAHTRWGDSSGRFDYASEAQWVLDLLRTVYFNSTYHLVQFVAGSGNTDGSYVLPAFYQVWACFDTDNAAYWNEAVTAGRNFFHAAADSNGVIPDRSSFDGTPQGSAGSDAKRCVMNIMMDHNFFAADPWQTETYAPAFGAYMLNRGGDTAQVACNALLGFGLPASSGQAFVDALWSTQIPTGQWRYYNGTLYMLALLHVSGTFKLWY